MKQPRYERGWGIVDAITGKLIVIDAQLPLYWRRRVAQDASNDAGFTYHGRDADVVIRRIEVRDL